MPCLYALISFKRLFVRLISWPQDIYDCFRAAVPIHLPGILSALGVKFWSSGILIELNKFFLNHVVFEHLLDQVYLHAVLWSTHFYLIFRANRWRRVKLKSLWIFLAKQISLKARLELRLTLGLLAIYTGLHWIQNNVKPSFLWHILHKIHTIWGDIWFSFKLLPPVHVMWCSFLLSYSPKNNIRFV